MVGQGASQREAWIPHVNSCDRAARRVGAGLKPIHHPRLSEQEGELEVQGPTHLVFDTWTIFSSQVLFPPPPQDLSCPQGRKWDHRWPFTGVALNQSNKDPRLLKIISEWQAGTVVGGYLGHILPLWICGPQGHCKYSSSSSSSSFVSTSISSPSSHLGLRVVKMRNEKSHWRLESVTEIWDMTWNVITPYCSINQKY